MGGRTVHQGFHPDDAGDADKQPQHEEEHNAGLFEGVHLQSSDDGQGHQAHPDIQNRVKWGPAPAEGHVIDAVAGQRSLPVLLDRYALHDRGDDEAESPACYDGN